MKTNSATEPIESAKKFRTDLIAEITSLNAFTASNASQRAKLELEGNLANASIVAEITRCQTIAALLPARLTHREEQLNLAEATLLKECHAFISSQLGPRARAMASAARNKIAGQLKPQFPDEAELERIVSNSALVRRYDGISYHATISDVPAGGVTAYADRLLQAFADCDNQEVQLA